MSGFFVRKVKTLFKQLDLDHDGYLSLKDYVAMAERHCDTEKANAVDREKVTGAFAKVSYFQLSIKLIDDVNILKPTWVET